MRGIACILVYASASKQFLVQRRSRSVDQPRTYHIPSGYIDAYHEQQNPSQAALRELWEETGYAGKISIEHLYTTSTKPNGTPVYVYIGIVPEAFHTKSNWESEEHKWVSFEQLSTGSVHPLHSGLEEIRQSNELREWMMPSYV